MIENYLLEQFVAFSECGTLSKAAEMLHISQPSLTRSMKKIENEFGVALFHRGNSKIALNETGKVAVAYAKRALDANQEMIDQVLAFDRSLRTVSLGACTPFPVTEILPTLQERLPGKTILTEIADDEKLVAGLKNRTYQMAILHHDPDDKSLFCQRFMEENLYVSLPTSHPLANKKAVAFDDLRGTKILMSGNVGFWKAICLDALPAADLLIQTNFDAFSELVEATTLPLFNTDVYLERGYQPQGRISIPVRDPQAHAVYWLAALTSEQKTYRSIFNALRGNTLKKQ